MAIKVQILAPCRACDGEAYVPVEQAVSNSGQPYIRYKPCPECQGSGNSVHWIGLDQFADLLEKATRLEADYVELAGHAPISQYQDSREAAGI